MGTGRAGQGAAPLPLGLFSLIVFIRHKPWGFPRRDLLLWLCRGGQQPLGGADSPSPTPALAFANRVPSWLETTSDFPGACLLKQNALQGGAACAAAPRSRKLPSAVHIQTSIFGITLPSDPPVSTG